MNEAMEMMENVTDVVTEEATDMTPMDCQSTEGNIWSTVIKGLVFVGAIATVVVIKNKDKIAAKADARQIKRLSKRGYIVSVCQTTVEDEIQDDCGAEVDAE